MEPLRSETAQWVPKMDKEEFNRLYTEISTSYPGDDETSRRKRSDEHMLLHRRYYAQFVDRVYIDKVLRHIGHTDILTSPDPFFNDITLRRWDLAPEPYDYRRKLRLCGDAPTQVGNAVIVAKEAARQWQDEQINLYCMASLEYNHPTTGG